MFKPSQKGQNVVSLNITIPPTSTACPHNTLLRGIALGTVWRGGECIHDSDNLHSPDSPADVEKTLQYADTTESLGEPCYGMARFRFPFRDSLNLDATMSGNCFPRGADYGRF